MEVVGGNTLLPGDPRLIDHIVCELKSQGIFDQFRKECIADVDTKPAYQNLRQRVEGSVVGFLKTQNWRPDMNKNQLREMLRKNIYESGFLETGVERIVDQVVNPKINTVFLPQVEEVVYKFLGLSKPTRNAEFSPTNGPLSINPVDLLPTDLEAISPDFEVLDKKMVISDVETNLDDSKNDEFESPPFEPITEQSVFEPQDESSNDSRISGISGLTSHDSNMSEEKVNIEVNNQDSQLSKVSSNSRLSIVTTDSKHTPEKMDISDDTGDSTVKIEQFVNLTVTDNPIIIKEEIQDDLEGIRNEINGHNLKKEQENNENKTEIEVKPEVVIKEEVQDILEPEIKEEPKTETSKIESKKSDSRHRSDSEKRKHSSSKDDKKSDKDKKYKSSSSSSRDKDKIRDKSRDNKSKSRDDRDKKTSSSSTSTSTSKHSSRDRNRSKSESKSSKSSKSTKSTKKEDDSKSSSKSRSRDHSKTTSKDRKSSSSKDYREKKDKKPKDDHSSSRDKKSDSRRSADRDSNDGSSGVNQSSTTTTTKEKEGSSSASSKKSEQSDFSGSNSGDSGQSDQFQNTQETKKVDLTLNEVALNPPQITQSIQSLKLKKPKIASNIFEVRKLMKIRKKMEKMEKKRQRQQELAAESETKSPASFDDTDSVDSAPQNLEELVKNIATITGEDSAAPNTSAIVSKESWDAIEAKLSQSAYENVDFNLYGGEDTGDSSSNSNSKCNDSSLKRAKRLSEEEDCLYFSNEVSPTTERFLQSIETFQKNSLLDTPLVKTEKPVKKPKKDDKLKGKKRKFDVEEKCDTENNNKTTDVLDNLTASPSGSNLSNGSIDAKPKSRAKKTKKTTVNYSPSSDVDTENVGETKPVKQPRASIFKSQRYSSDDLYKPRPVVSGTSRRQRGLLNNTG